MHAGLGETDSKSFLEDMDSDSGEMPTWAKSRQGRRTKSKSGE